MQNSNTNRPGPQLIDSFGRRIEYIRLSVTDKCNLRCFYCLPKGFKSFENQANWLTFEEIERVVKAFSELGVHRVRLTGGEPLVRKNLARLSARLSSLPGINDLSLSTNATLLENQADALYAAGIRRINVSLDTLDEDRYADITGGGKLDCVLRGLQKAHEVGFKPIKINMVVLKDTPLEEHRRIMQYCMQNDFTLRFIETMPMGTSGRDGSEQYLSLKKVNGSWFDDWWRTRPILPNQRHQFSDRFYYTDIATFLRNLQSRQNISRWDLVSVSRPGR